jgi:hypothetical protein
MAHKFSGWYEMLFLIPPELVCGFEVHNGLFLDILQLVSRTHVVEMKTAKAGSPNKFINKCKLEIQMR